jgi:predicted PurR-regulated permease PerM
MDVSRALAPNRTLRVALIAICVATLLVVACALLYLTRVVLLTLLIGLGLGVIIRPVVDWIKDRGKIGEKLAVPAVLLGLLGVFAGIAALVYEVLSDQVIPLSRKMPQYIQSVQGKAQALSEKYHFLPAHMDSQNLGGSVQNAFQKVLGALGSSAAIGADLFFVVAVCLYFASSPNEYFRGFLSVFPAHARPRAADVMHKSASAVRTWFATQIIAMVIVGTLLGVSLKFLGHPYWVLLGIITGVLEIVPMVGPAVSLAVGVLITLAAQPEHLLAVAVVYLVLLQVEGNLIIPLLMKGRVELPPIQLLTFMLVFAEFFGAPGILISPAMLAVARTLYIELYLPWVDKMKRPRPGASVAHHVSSVQRSAS